MSKPSENLLARRKSLTPEVSDWTTRADRDAMPNDKQKYRRSAVYLPAVIKSGGKTIVCDVLNISAGGALIRTAQSTPIEGEFVIEIEGVEQLKAEVVRSHRHNHGIAFHEDPKKVGEMVAELLAAAPHTKEKRVFPRRLVLLAVSFYVGDQFVQGKIHNLSAGGVHVRADVLPEVGESMELNLSRFGVMRVRVVWTSESAMGACFLDTSREIMDRIGHLLPVVPDQRS